MGGVHLCERVIYPHTHTAPLCVDASLATTALFSACVFEFYCNIFGTCAHIKLIIAWYDKTGNMNVDIMEFFSVLYGFHRHEREIV